MELKITVDDLRRAILNGGDVSSFAKVYEDALGGSPVPIAGSFDMAYALPSAMVLARGAEASPGNVPRPQTALDGGQSPEIELRLISAHSTNSSDGFGIAQAIEDFKPDAVALDCSEQELAARVLYTFSLPCAVGLGVRLEILRQGEVDTEFDGSLSPGGVEETAILETWLRHVPLVAVGQASRTIDGKTSDAEALETASRIREGAGHFCIAAGKLRLLVILDPERHSDFDQFNRLVERHIQDGETRQSQADPDDEGVVIGHFVKPEETENSLTGMTPAARLFAAAFERRMNEIVSEKLPAESMAQIAAEIVARTRRHPDVERGASVRGTLAFHELQESLSTLNGAATRASVAKAARIALPPRMTVKSGKSAAAIVDEIVKEVLYGVRLSDRRETEPDTNGDGQGVGAMPGALDEVVEMTGRKETGKAGDASFSIVPERAEEPEQGNAGQLDRSLLAGMDTQDSYFSAKKAFMSMINDLEAKYRAGKITQQEFERHKNALMQKFRDAVRSAMRMSGRELAETVVQMMDAQDKQWNSELNFSTMHVYYHIKGTSEGASLSPFKQDYQALKWMVDDLETENILRRDGGAGFLLTGIALEVLLKYLTKGNIRTDGSRERDRDGASSSERSHEVRRYSRGDRFHDLSIRHTLREIARQKRELSDVRSSDLRVMLREHRNPHHDIMLCIDTSGSMGFGQKLTYARLAAAGLVKAALQAGDRVGIVAFSDRGQNVVQLTGNDQAELLDGIAALSSNGNTNIGDGMKTAREMLASCRSRNRKQMILITDGQASAVSEGAFAQLRRDKKRDMTEESALWETRQAAANGTQVSVVYIAPRDEAVDGFIQDMAAIGGGAVHRVSGAGDLENAWCTPARPASQAGRAGQRAEV